MSIRFIRFEHPDKFDTIEDATKEANAIKAMLYRFTRKNNIACTAMICVSEHDLRNAEAVFMMIQRRGRPRKKFVSKIKFNTEPEKVEPHLHIIVCYEKQGDAIAKKIIKNITLRSYKRNGEYEPEYEEIDPFQLDQCYTLTNPLYYIKYVIKQASIIRYVEDYTKTIPFDFKNMVRLYIEKKTGIYFHKNHRRHLPQFVPGKVC